jgi:hypothetical protein
MFGSAASLLALLLATAILAPSSPAQAPIPPEDPALPGRLDEIEKMLADRAMRDDFRAIGLIQMMVKAPDQLHPKDKGRLAKALGDVFRIGKVRPAGQDHVYREAGDALAKLGEDGGKPLARALADKRLDDNLPLRAHLTEALGRTQDDRQIDWLIEVATRSPHDELRAAAGTALGEFTAAPVKLRREIVKALIREWGSLHSKATEPTNFDSKAPIDFGPQNAQKTLQVIEARWVRTLSRLTGERMSGFADWQRWLNKNPNWEPPKTK